ncbi:MAG TPA: RNA polymerase sigma factor [Gemmatimonadales bacterium]
MSAPLPSLGPTMSEPADAQLVARTLEGDDTAYATLVRRHQHRLYRHARGMGIDHDTSLDLVQDAFARAFERLVDCRDGASYRAWLFRICRNLCLDELRNVRRLAVPMSELERPGDFEDPRAGGDDLTLTLRAALERLPNALREAFLLKHDAGYTYDEVAAITEASPSAVKMRVHRAREALRAFLSREGVSRVIEPIAGGDECVVAERLPGTDAHEPSTGDARTGAVHAYHSRRIS